MSCGDLLSASIDVAGEIDVFRFAGVTGDVIALTVVETSNWGVVSFDPGRNDARMTVRAPSGTVVGTFDSNVQPELTLAETGTYIVQVNANNLVSVGSYNLSLTCF